MKYNKPTLWKEALLQMECYFCVNDVTGFNRKNKQSFVYTNGKTVEQPERSCCNERNSDNFENKNYLKVRNDSDEYSDESEYHENDDDYIPGGGKERFSKLRCSRN